MSEKFKQWITDSQLETNISSIPVCENKLVVVKVGSDERPASPEDISGCHNAIEEFFEGDELQKVLVTHHLCSFMAKKINGIDFLFTKLGNEERPASPEDIKTTDKIIRNLFAGVDNVRIIVTHHAIEFYVEPREDQTELMVFVGNEYRPATNKEIEESVALVKKEIDGIDGIILRGYDSAGYNPNEDAYT